MFRRLSPTAFPLSFLTFICAVFAPLASPVSSSAEEEPASLRKLRADKDARIQKGLTSVYQSYLESLNALQKELTVKADLEGALAVKKEVEATRATLDRLAEANPKDPGGAGVSVPGVTGKWTPIFRSADPADWLTGKNRDCPSLADVPEKMKYLRLRRLDTGDAVIIPLTKDLIDKSTRGRDDARDAPYWHGSNRFDSTARHLGIASPQFKSEGGMISVSVEGGHFTGWGFGHRHFGDGGQFACWAGKEIRRTGVEFEVAVSEGPLVAFEERLIPEGTIKE